MPSPSTNEPGSQELDVRGMRKPDKHPTIFATYDALSVGGSFVLVNDHDPVHLRQEFEAGHPGAFGWQYLNREMRDWRILITKLASTPLPRVLVDAGTTDAVSPAADGTVWQLDVAERDLDASIIALPPHGTIDVHAGPDLDVLVHVLAGSGILTTEVDPVELAPGQVLWLPRRSQRRFAAGADGLRYLGVHRRRPSLALDPRGVD